MLFIIIAFAVILTLALYATARGSIRRVVNGHLMGRAIERAARRRRAEEAEAVAAKFDRPRK